MAATVLNSSDVSIFGSQQRATITVLNSENVGIFGVTDGEIQLGPKTPGAIGQGVTNATIETTGFGASTSTRSILIDVANSTDVGIFGSGSPVTASMATTVLNSTNVSIFGSPNGGSIRVTNSENVGIFGQSSETIDLHGVRQTNCDLSGGQARTCDALS